ncbi:MAG TPA: helix-turn-helix domain-containing protein [Vicinamibacterales bacterium]|jgi:hypothetical protein|nr:helix-turn-helix domain-containing protein [Vicinamibacterales bacterium]
MTPLLRETREHRGLSVPELMRRTGLPLRTVTAIDEERYQDLPAGIYARSAVRMYAQAVGLDPSRVLDEVRGQLPETHVDLMALADRRAAQTAGRSRRYAPAAAIDAAALLAISAAILYGCGAFCQLTPLGLLRVAPVAATALCAMPVALYVWLLGATGVGTIGPWLLGVEILPAAEGPLSLETWFSRGLQYASREIALALEGLVRRRLTSEQS